MNKFILLATAALMLCVSVLPASGQDKSSNVIRIKGVVQDRDSKDKLPGAHVTVKYGSDSTVVATMKNGSFDVQDVPKGPFTLKISFLGYAPMEIDYKADAVEVDFGYIQMVQEGYMMDGVSVLGTIKMMTIDGDTIKYNPAAFKSVAGDYAIDLVVKMPGIDIDENGKIKAHGKDVSWTLVDGRLIFGRDALTALSNVKADDLKYVKVYDVANPEEKGAELASGKENYQRVIDLETKSKFTMAQDAKAELGIGADMNRGGNLPDYRYKGSASFGMFSEKLNISVGGYFNNTKEIQELYPVTMSSGRYRSDDSNYSEGYGRRNKLGVLISNRNPFARSNKWTGSLEYTYSNTYDKSSSLSNSIYAPNINDQVRETLSQGDNNSNSNSHNVSINIGKTAKSMSLTISPSYSYSDSKRNSWSRSIDYLDDLAKANNQSNNHSNNDSHQFGLSVSYHKLLANYDELMARRAETQEKKQRMFATSIMATVRGGYSENDMSGWVRDTSYLTMPAKYTRVFTNSSDGYSKTASATVSVRDLKLAESLGMNVSYTFDYDNSKTKRLAFDEMTGMADPNSTLNHTTNHLTNSIVPELRFNKFPGKIIVNLSLGFKNVYVGRDELYPTTINENHYFNAFVPALTVSNSGGERSISKQNYWSFTYRTSARQPSLEQMRDWLDDTNKTNLSYGNPLLKQSYTHSINFNYNFGNVNSSQMGSVFVGGSIENNNIVSDRISFLEDTVLPQYGNYTAIAGSSLTTYRNVGGGYSATAGAFWSRPAIGNKFVFRSNLAYYLYNSPSFLEGKKIENTSNSGYLDLNLRSNHSNVVEYTIGSSTIYSFERYSGSSRNDNRIFRQVLSARADVNIVQNLSFSTWYDFDYSNGSSTSKVENHNLNASLSYKFHKRAGEAKFVIYDIFNRNSGYYSYANEDYVISSWRDLMSRYFMFSVSYRFNRTSSGMSPKGGGDVGPRGRRGRQSGLSGGGSGRAPAGGVVSGAGRSGGSRGR